MSKCNRRFKKKYSMSLFRRETEFLLLLNKVHMLTAEAIPLDYQNDPKDFNFGNKNLIRKTGIEN